MTMLGLLGAAALLLAAPNLASAGCGSHNPRLYYWRGHTYQNVGPYGWVLVDGWKNGGHR